MNIAIYGDSWGSLKLNEPHSYLGWPEILNNQLNIKVFNFSVVGSSLYYSYKKFINSYKYYDVNIFLMTSPGRLYIPDMPVYADSAKHVSGLSNVLERKEFLKKANIDRPVKEHIEKINDALELYYVYLHNHERDKDFGNALMFYAKSLTNNTIFIPCFEHTDYPVSLIDIYDMENRVTGISEKYLLKGIQMNSIVNGKCLRDNRVCHLTKRNNEILAEKIIDAINDKTMSINLSVEDFVKPTESLDEILVWKEL